MTHLRLCAVAVLALLAACAPPPKPLTPAQALDQRELAAVDNLHFRQKYKDLVLGDDVKGTTLVLYVDRNNVESMNEQDEDAMLADVLSHWKAIWKAHNHGKHAKVHVSARDFYGDELERRSAQV